MSGVEEQSPLKFILLVFALSAPFWLIGAVTGAQLSPDLPVSALIFVVPVIAAALLRYRENGTAGVVELLRRSFDYRRIRSKRWYGAIVLLPLAIAATTYAVLRLLSLPLPTVRFPILAALVTLVAYLISGLAEELGWTGYATDPLQQRWNALQTGLLLGVVWAVFHFVPLAQHGRSLGWIAWWSLGTVTLRVLLVWVYKNTGNSVFATALFHAMIDLGSVGPFLDFGPAGYPYHAQQISAVITALAAAAVTLAWGPRTLARLRRSSPAGRAAPVS